MKWGKVAIQDGWNSKFKEESAWLCTQRECMCTHREHDCVLKRSSALELKKSACVLKESAWLCTQETWRERMRTHTTRVHVYLQRVHVYSNKVHVYSKRVHDCVLESVRDYTHGECMCTRRECMCTHKKCMCTHNSLYLQTSDNFYTPCPQCSRICSPGREESDVSRPSHWVKWALNILRMHYQWRHSRGHLTRTWPAWGQVSSVVFGRSRRRVEAMVHLAGLQYPVTKYFTVSIIFWKWPKISSHFISWELQ